MSKLRRDLRLGLALGRIETVVRGPREVVERMTVTAECRYAKAEGQRSPDGAHPLAYGAGEPATQISRFLGPQLWE
jgi:hypothetical protein